MTKNPRLSITLQPTLAAQLKAISRLTGNSQSSIISELLDGSAPVLDRLIAVLTAAESAKDAMKGKLTSDMLAAQTKLEANLGISLGLFDEVTKPLLDKAEAIQRRARKVTPGRASGTSGASREREPTPISNRGVRYDQTTTKKIATRSIASKKKPGKSGKTSSGLL